MKTIIGKLILKESEVFTNTFEVACWYEKVLVPAGEYDIEYCTDRRMYYITLHGTIVEAHFPSLLGGVAISSNNNDKDKIGKETSVHKMHYGFQIASLAYEEPNRYVLNEGVKIESRLVDRGDGTSFTSYRLDL